MLKVQTIPATHLKRDDQRKRGLARHDFFIGKAMEARASAFHCISFRSFKLISTNGCVGFTRSPCSHLIRCREIRCKSDRYDHSSAYNLESEGPAGFLTTTIKHLKSFYEFCRPHTIFGTVIGVTSVSLLPVKTVADISPLFFIGLLKFDFSSVTNFYISFYTAYLKSRKRRRVRDRLGEPAVKKQHLYGNETLTNWEGVVLGWALIPAVFMNIYVVGLNQIYDIEIDKVNKPNLPLASGELNIATGVTLVISFLIMSFYLGVKSGSPPLLGALVISFLLGSAYSIDHPLFRWKRHAFLAATCILCVRAILVQLAFYAHIQVYVLQRPLAFTKSVIFATAFMCFFAVVIALFKDIPDVNGDKHFGIQSFSVRLGQKRVFWLCIELLLTAYTIAILVGVASSDIYRRIVTVIGHGILASVLLIRARCLDIENKSSITSFYMFIWKLFYAEYLLIPFVH